MRRSILALVVLGTSTAAADLADEVRCREIGFSISAEKRDAEEFASFIDADARFVGSSVTRGPAAIADAWSVFLTDGGPAIKWRPQIIEVLEDGTLALSRGPYRMITEDENGEQTEHWGTFNSVWRLNEDGVWRVVFDAGSVAADPPTEEVQALLDQEDNCS
jgi:ketosteroid isomerase-like protein